MAVVKLLLVLRVGLDMEVGVVVGVGRVE